MRRAQSEFSRLFLKNNVFSSLLAAYAYFWWHQSVVQNIPLPFYFYVGSSSGEGDYVKGVVTITLLNKFKVQDVGVLEEKVIDMGVDEGMKLLRALLLSKTVLTSVFAGK
ncbi:hypothetical protein Gogos_003863 [Gossypium gossypioides]|uniref:Uncharacterized protein n=1 Tax=Gossypium gossypioides TaxID=34282 RepID=A0A7J9CNV9_GOSGO|nr:hypothetical protein [Gossypium gossypioides]